MDQIFDCCYKKKEVKTIKTPLLDKEEIIKTEDVYKKFTLSDIIENRKVVWEKNENRNSLSEYKYLLEKIKNVKR